jgi:hypothetical protein
MNYDCVILADRHQNMLEGIQGVLEATFNKAVMVADDTSLFDAAERLDVDLPVPVSKDINEEFPQNFGGLSGNLLKDKDKLI